MLRFAVALLMMLLSLSLAPVAMGQEQEQGRAAEDAAEAGITTPQQVSVEDVVDDERIARRLLTILETADRIDVPRVRVENGVVFLDGVAPDEDAKQWAGDLALRTDDVVAVVNRIAVPERSPLDFSESLDELRSMSGAAMRSLPKIAVALIVVALAFVLALVAARLARRWLRMQSPLLLDVTSKIIGILVFILGMYIALRVSGLTQLALTVVSGTGILGLILGIAFRDIAENFLASILLSMQRPFRAGDTIVVGEYTGIVQKVTTRGTLLMAFDGSFIQIPNATIYKETIKNISANPKSRFDFAVGIGYENSVSQAQQIALEVMGEHSAVLDDPEPMVLVEKLASSSIMLRLYFWINTDSFSGLKVKSALIRQVNRAFQDAGVSMPDDAREVLFPQPVPVRMLQEEAAPRQPMEPQPPAAAAAPAEAGEAHQAEGDLRSEVAEMQEQARESRRPEEGADLLAGNSAALPPPASAQQ